jgi:hypothetical protein
LLCCVAVIFTLNKYSFNFFSLFDHKALCPNVETLSLHTVIITGKMVELSLLYHFRNIGTVIACISGTALGTLELDIASQSYAVRQAKSDNV